MQDWLAAQAAARPDGLALICNGEHWTYRALNQQVARCAAWLAALGVERGAQVGVLLCNTPDAVLTIHAAARLGAVLVMLNTRLTPPELDALLAQTTCRLLLCDRETAGTALALHTPLQRVCVHADAAAPPALLAPDAVAPLPADALPGGVVQLEEPFAILFTSGTTGTPKGAVLTRGNVFYNALASAYRIGMLPHDRWLCSLPLYHIGGLSIIMRSCLYGTTVDLWQRFDAEAVSAALAHAPVTLVSLVPTMLARLLDAGERHRPPSALRLVLLGGAAASPDLLERARRGSLPVATTYGLTEATSQVATALPEQASAKPGSVGRPLLFTRVQVRGSDGEQVPAGQYGEIVVGGPAVMRGYLKHEPLPRDDEGVSWFATGDIGYLDAEGDLWMVQRRHDIIISGGENIYPAEVEAVLRQHPAVTEAAVMGVESAEWGQQVAAAIVLHDPLVTADDLLAFSRERLAGYKQPRVLRLVAELPRTASGKIHRPALQKLLEG